MVAFMQHTQSGLAAHPACCACYRSPMVDCIQLGADSWVLTASTSYLSRLLRVWLHVCMHGSHKPATQMWKRNASVLLACLCQGPGTCHKQCLLYCRCCGRAKQARYSLGFPSHIQQQAIGPGPEGYGAEGGIRSMKPLLCNSRPFSWTGTVYLHSCNMLLSHQ